MLASDSQIKDKDFDQLICDRQTWRGSAARPDGGDGATRLSTQVTLYARELAWRSPNLLHTGEIPRSARPLKAC